VSPQADIFEAVALILDNKISGLCVVDEEGALVGVLSELDCLEATLSAMYDGGRTVGQVGDYMTRIEDVITAGERSDIIDVAKDMVKNKRRRRPVIKDGKLVGQITCRQLLRAIRDFSSGKSPAKAVAG
jgi:CBS domain-containing protein